MKKLNIRARSKKGFKVTTQSDHGLPSKAFAVTVDFLIGEGEYASLDKDTVDRINNIQQLDQNTRSILFNLIDTYIQNFKTKQAFAK